MSKRDESGTLFGRAQRHRMDTLSHAAARRFAWRRERHIQWVIASSEYLQRVWRGDPEGARRKAIQAIRRDPADDRPDVIGLAERRALARARAHLGEMAWRLYQPDAIARLIAERSERDGLARDRGYFVRYLARRFAARVRGGAAGGAAALSPGHESAAACAEVVLSYHGDGDIAVEAGDIASQLASTGSPPVIALVCFVCVRLDARALAEGDLATMARADFSFPWPRGHRRTALRLIEDLRAAGARVRFRVIVADTDPLLYVLPILCPEVLATEGGGTINEQLRAYAAAHGQRYQGWLDDTGAELARWSVLEREVADWPEFWAEARGSNGFEPGDVALEVELMARDFAPGGYFAGVPRPSPEGLREMAIRKHALYAAQGMALCRLDPGSAIIVLQNEVPCALRTRMLTALTRARAAPLRVIAPYPARVVPGPPD